MKWSEMEINQSDEAARALEKNGGKREYFSHINTADKAYANRKKCKHNLFEEHWIKSKRMLKKCYSLEICVYVRALPTRLAVQATRIADAFLTQWHWIWFQPFSPLKINAGYLSHNYYFILLLIVVRRVNLKNIDAHCTMRLCEKFEISGRFMHAQCTIAYSISRLPHAIDN